MTTRQSLSLVRSQLQAQTQPIHLPCVRMMALASSHDWDVLRYACLKVQTSSPLCTQLGDGGKASGCCCQSSFLSETVFARYCLSIKQRWLVLNPQKSRLGMTLSPTDGPSRLTTVRVIQKHQNQYSRCTNKRFAFCSEPKQLFFVWDAMSRAWPQSKHAHLVGVNYSHIELLSNLQTHQIEGREWFTTEKQFAVLTHTVCTKYCSLLWHKSYTACNQVLWIVFEASRI